MSESGVDRRQTGFLLSRMGVRAKLSLLFYSIVFFSLSAVGYYGYINASDAYLSKAKGLVSERTRDVANYIEGYLLGVPYDLQFISHHHALNQFLYWQDLGVMDKGQHWKSVTLDTVRSFLAAHDDYYKISFLDQEGQEQIKIRYDHRSGQVNSESGLDLQGNAHADYFRETFALDKGGLFVSQLDLNTEFGKIEKPFVPVIRYAQPVVGDNNVKYGVAVINVLADHLLDFVRKANQDENSDYFLISQKGDYFLHPDPGRSWGHLIGHPNNFQDDFPEIFDRLQKDRGTLVWQGNVISFHRIYPNTADREHYWYLVGMVKEAGVLGQLDTFVTVFFTILAITILVVVVASRVAIGQILEPLAAITRQLEHLGEGEISREAIVYRHADEIGRMLSSTQRLMFNMEALSQQVNTISSGDYSQRVKVLSEKDLLGHAINNMTATLEENQRVGRRQDWLNSGLTQLSQQLSGDLKLNELAARSTAFICRYVMAGHGAFFVLEHDREEAKSLVLIGSFMFTDRDALHSRFALGEGAVGQVALEKQPILLKNIKRDQALLTTGTVETPPLNTYTLPLLYEGEVHGVLEVASPELFSDNKRRFLDEAMNVVAAYLYSALQRDRITNLLKTSEEAFKQAEEQSRVLQETNAQMEEQQQQLQQQTEELQQTNAQMEEQQQQLQQQTEELQQANAQMEEQRQQVEQQSEELRRNNATLRKSQEEINIRAQQLEEANRYKSDFLANMSHELRTPLNAIIVISRMMSKNEDGKLDEETIKRAQVVHNAGNDLLRLISDILDLSKIEAGRMEIHLERFSTEDLAGEMQGLFADGAQEKKLDWVVQNDYQGEITSDRHKLVQVLRNLLSNAFKFTHQGQVTLAFQASGIPKRPLNISVSDTGIGIPKNDLEQIFEAFRQVDGSISREYGGTGLGLSITKKFVELLDGVIEVQSKEGRGSTFTLLLPEQPASSQDTFSPLRQASGVKLSQSQPQSQPHPLPQPQPTQPLEQHHSPPPSEDEEGSILVIDDDPLFQENIASINRFNSRNTLSALSGEAGLAMAKLHRPAGIILDLGLPDMPGEEVLERLKTDSKLKSIPVYIISARDKDQALLDQKGVIGFLQKPVTERQIESAETALLQAVGVGYKNFLILEGPALKKGLVAEKVDSSDSSLIAVDSAQEGLDWAEKESFDLVLTDHDLADMDCLEFCEKLQNRQPNIPIIIYCSSKLDEERLLRLRHFTDSVIQDAPQAGQRVFRDIERFLAAATSDGEPRPGTLALDGNRSLNGRHVLIVDDDPRNLFVLTSSLEQNGARVTQALNGRKALVQLEKEPVDLIFMDIMMPEMNGYEAIQAIRQKSTLKGVPIIALTAKALKEDRQKCLAAGADDYLSKPVDYEVLLNMAMAWIEKRS
ncbi:MAG: response regulator [Magnetococcales bacterium]|nr:response regulator [Magnetococcales bacterium]